MEAEIEDDERWPIPPERRGEIVDFLFQTMRTEEPKDGIAAAKLLVALDKINAEHEEVLGSLTFDQLRMELSRRLEALESNDVPGQPSKARSPVGIVKKTP